MDYSSVVKLIRPSIAKVIVIDPTKKHEVKNGSGFVFQRKGLLVTCNHVVKDSARLILLNFSDKPKDVIKANVVIRDEENDLALLDFDDNSRPPLQQRNVEEVEEGMEVLFAGYPLSLKSLTTHQGILSSITSDATGATTYLIDGTVNPGNSGCPLMGNDGRVIGVVSALQREGRKVLDKVEEMKTGAISLHSVDLVDIYQALMSNLQLGIGYAVPAAYIPEHKSQDVKADSFNLITEKKVKRNKPRKKQK